MPKELLFKKAFIGISAHLPHRHMRQSFLNGPLRPLFLYFHLFWVAIDRHFYVWIRVEVHLIPMSAMYNFQNKMIINIHFNWYFARKNPFVIHTHDLLTRPSLKGFSLSCSSKKSKKHRSVVSWKDSNSKFWNSERQIGKEPSEFQLNWIEYIHWERTF